MRKAFYFALILFFSSYFVLLFGQEEDDIIVLPSTAIVNQDYFAYGKSIEISGIVNGNVYIFGGKVFIDGVVNGDLVIAGGSVEISGRISQNVWLLSGQTSITGTVGKNITAITAAIELYPSAYVGQNVMFVADEVDLEATVGHNARIYASHLRLSDKIRGKLRAYVGSMRITSRAHVKGGIEYWSNKSAFIDSHAQIEGELIHHPSFFYKIFHGKIFKSLKIGSKFVGLIMNFFYTLVIALIIMRYFPQSVERTIEVLNTKVLQSLLAGFMLVIILPLLCVALLITIVGVPFALTLLAINLIGFYTAKILTIIWLTVHFFRKIEFGKHRRLCFILGLLIYYILTAIPYFGSVIAVVALLLGLGGLVLGKIDQSNKSKIIG